MHPNGAEDRSTNWFGQTFRKVHILYVSPQGPRSEARHSTPRRTLTPWPRPAWTESILLGLEVQPSLSCLRLAGVQRVYASPDVALPYQEADGWLTMSVPPLHIHGILVAD